MIDLVRTPRIIAGAGALGKVSEVIREISDSIFIIATRSFRNSTYHDRLLESLTSAGISYEEAPAVSGEPSVEMIDSASEAARNFKATAVLSIGGGSAMDAGKGVALLLSSPGSVGDYQMGRRKIAAPAAPHITIPTTAGTGSDANGISVITNIREGVKKSVRHTSLVPKAALLDPQLTAQLPARLTALTAMDALSHAIESFVSLNANSLSEAASIKAIELISENLPRVVSAPLDLEARREMLIAAHLAGFALNAGVGAMHILAQPVSVATGLRHSEAITALMIPVLRFNEGSTPKTKKIAAILGAPDAEEGVWRLMRKAGLTPEERPKLEKEKVAEIIKGAKLSTWHNRSTNPRPVSEEDLVEIAGEAFELI